MELEKVKKWGDKKMSDDQGERMEREYGRGERERERRRKERRRDGNEKSKI